MFTNLARRQETDTNALACLQGIEPCGDVCPLQACKTGNRAVVVRVDCPTAEACRLRALGVYEGARVSVVDSRNGLLLQVRGSRLAIGAAVAAAISVIPVP
ncbi:MAG TPA: FeoA family protein [Gemmatimonadaceae bacterium]|nr:FeoA family protein [Gemmatimonadaceae bacterium]